MTDELSQQEAQQEREYHLYRAMMECIKKGVSIESLQTLAFETGFDWNEIQHLRSVINESK
jgi:hypothetical protein